MHGSGLGLMVGLRDPFLTSVTLQSYNSMSGMGWWSPWVTLKAFSDPNYSSILLRDVVGEHSRSVGLTAGLGDPKGLF